MNRLIQGVDIKDELNLELVTYGLKPACQVTLNPLYFDFISRGLIEYKGETFLFTGSDVKIGSGVIKFFKSFLKRLDVPFHQGKTETWQTYNIAGERINIERIPFLVGKNSSSLERLLNASNDEEIGLALGYPIEAVKAYGKIINGEKRDGQYLQTCLAKAKQAGLELPLWIAYISHIPEELDLVNGKVSETSKVLGKRYQAFIRGYNPNLAMRVEQHFLNTKLPDSWEKTSDGSYILYFKV